MVISEIKCPVCGTIYNIHCLEIPPVGVEVWLWHKKLNTCPKCGYVKYTSENGETVEEFYHPFQIMRGKYEYTP